jgi:hypothetical protein
MQLLNSNKRLLFFVVPYFTMVSICKQPNSTLKFHAKMNFDALDWSHYDDDLKL